MRLRVLLVDDHAVVREGYRRLLERTSDIDVVAEAANGETAYRLFCDTAPDVVVMDITLPGVSGVETTRRILTREPRRGCWCLACTRTSCSLRGRYRPVREVTSPNRARPS